MLTLDILCPDRERLLVEVLELPINLFVLPVYFHLLAVFSLSHFGHSAESLSAFEILFKPVVMVINFDVDIFVLMPFIIFHSLGCFSRESDGDAIVLRY